MCVLQSVSLMYVCIVRITTFGITTEPRVLREEYDKTGCPGNESISNTTRTGNVSLSQDFDDWSNITTVNISDTVELHCSASKVYLSFLWIKTGSKDPLGTTETLQLKNVSLWDTGSYICFLNSPCDVNNTSNIPKNLSRTTYVQVNGPPIFIFPVERKSFLVAEGQPIQFTITVGSSSLPNQYLKIWRSSMKIGVGIDVKFKRTSSSALEKIPDGMPVYSADVKLTNITLSWTGDFILFVNNSYGSVTYNFSVNVHKPDEVPWWRSNTEIFVGIGVGVLLMVTLVVGTIVMCRSRYKQKILQETVKDLEEAEKKGSMDSLDIWGHNDGNKEFDSLSEEASNRQLQSLNTFNNPEETSDGNIS